MQRLLVEGMQTVLKRSGFVVGEPVAAEADLSRMEAYGHLAAALLPLMVKAPDEQLETLTGPPFLPAVAFAFQLGARLAVLLMSCLPPADSLASWVA